MDLPPPIYAEAEVPGYTLPALGQRGEMLEELQRVEYGLVPDIDLRRSAELIERGSLAGAPGITREQWRVTLETDHGSSEFVMAVFLPEQGAAGAPLPIFLGLNFFGNHTVHADPAIVLTAAWSPQRDGMGVVEHRATDAGRGVGSLRWPIDMIAERGYGVATIYCGEFAPDDADHWREGAARVWAAEPGDARPGAIATWAWGLSRAREVLAENPRVDTKRIAVFGHSRLGKTSLLAGAQDDAFALVISNGSGCGGAALSRRRIGERLIHINTHFPHWFTPAFDGFNERESDLPVDQHQLLAAVAPRALYVASAEGDQWADPRGEYLALVAAGEAWGETLPDESPAVGEQRVRRMLGYHCRAGKHDLRPEDWRRFMDFADEVLEREGE